MPYHRRGYGRGEWRGRFREGGGRWKKTRGFRGKTFGRGQNFTSDSQSDNYLMAPPSIPSSSGSQKSSNSMMFGTNPAVKILCSSQRVITTMLPKVPCPYKGWSLYMTESYNENSDILRYIKVFEEFLNSHKDILKQPDIQEKHSFKVHLNSLCVDSLLNQKLGNIEEMLEESPLKVINCLGLAMHQILTIEMETRLRQDAVEVLFRDTKNLQKIDNATVESVIPETNLPIVNCRLFSSGKLTPLKNLRANFYGKFVSIKGTVVRVSSIKPLCKVMAFSCLSCGTVHGLGQVEGKYTVPTSCPTPECHSFSFTPERSHILTQTIDWQSVRLQEVVEDDQGEGGRIPRSIDCELTEDLVDTCVPGDMVIVTGVAKVSQSDEGHGKSDKCMFSLYIDANSITNCKAGSDMATAAGIEFSIRDYYAIQEIQAMPDLFRVLVSSLCPAIYGHEMVKVGLLLCLFGGCTKSGPDRIPVRGDPHILIVGDPGLGKSQMLRACSAVAPRGIYICGNTATKSGLTVTLTRESGSNDYALNAGALVLADQGCCCIDEFDKMGNQHQALLEAMEQQCISIAKAGVVCSLPARTSILAAANPVGGHYNKAKTVSENLKMNTALLSRFDLVFILLDKPNEELDCLLSEHVMALHSAAAKTKTSKTESDFERQDMLNTSVMDHDKPLCERLKMCRGENRTPISYSVLRKYICYARKYVKPRIVPAAAKLLQQFYLELREKHQSVDSTPITTRQLESLIRLTESRARCELREEATENDAKDVVETMRFSMLDTFTDEHGFLDFRRSQHGSGTSTKSQMKKFVAALQRVSSSTYKSIFSIDEMKQIAQQARIQVPNFMDFITTLNHQGYLLKKGNKVYQLLTANS